MTFSTDRAVILVRPGPTGAEQTVAVLRLCDERGYEIVGQCHRAEDCVALVAAGAATVAVATHEVRRENLDDAVSEAGGRVEYVRQPERRVSARTWLVRWWSQGRSVEQIAADTGERTGEIRSMLRRAGKKIPPKK